MIYIFAETKIHNTMPSEGFSKYKPNELLAYRDSLKDYRDYYNTIDFAEIKGRKQGRAEGAQSKAYEIARSLKALGKMTIAEIASATGLSEDEIIKICNN